LLVHLSRFGPFHIARLNDAANTLKPLGIKVVGMEITSQIEMYPWDVEEHPTAFERYVALPRCTFEYASPLEMWRGVRSVLDKVNPDAVAINGYSMADAWSTLAWCKLHRRIAIIMSDSKSDDSPRVASKEWVKKMILRQFDAALCAGLLSKSYLEELGMQSQKIFLGFDAVDNDYFWKKAEVARQNPSSYRALPGLETSDPFFLASSRFVKSKNFDGLLSAYAEYRRRLHEANPSKKPWRLVLLGDGAERRALEHQVWSEGIRGVTFPGFRQIEDLPVYYGRAKVFIHPSYQDTWGLVVNEAMAAGLPVIVSKRSGCVADLVSNGQNGFIFSPEDLKTLAELMLLISSDSVDLTAMSLASRKRIEDWGLPRFSQGLYGALQVGLNNHRKPVAVCGPRKRPAS
jgi:glycosyltransferase involved in cell wall biosynthesis